MKTSFRVLIGAAMILLILGPSAAAWGEEVRPGIQILHGIHANLPNDDLKPLKRVIGDRPVVALGESVHTSGGYSRLKYRVFRYLVEEMGFRAYAFESPWVGADRVAEYVQSCEGEPEEAITGLFPVWQNESVRDLVKWMCVWNHRHPDDRVYFFGFDMQQPEDDAPALKAYLERVGLADDDPRVQGIERCSQSSLDWWGDPYQEDDYQECVTRLDQLSRFLDRREANLVRRTSRQEFELARIHLVGFRAWQDELYYWPSPTEWYRAGVARDEAMAWIFAALWDLRFPGIKTVIWAHNFHIEEDAATSYGDPSMGTYLAEALGDDYVTLGLISYRVDIDWPGVGCGRDEVNHWRNAVELLLHDLGQPYLFVDLDFRGSDRPLLEPGRRYQVGGARAMVPRDHYDGFFFLDHSPAMVPVNREPCQ